jgi:dihydroorotase
MAPRFDLVLKGGTIVAPDAIQSADIGVKGGVIAAIGALAAGDAAQVIDAKGLHVLPGVIDTQVHFREPGLTHKEDLATGSAAAVLGGVTSVFEMPNTLPPTTTAELLKDKLNRADGRMRCDYAFYLGATADNVDRLAELELLPGCAGVKIFMGASTGDLLLADDLLPHALKAGRRRVAVHAEDESRLKERRPLAEIPNATPGLHPVWRDVETAVRATSRLIALARECRRPVHVLHVSTAEEIDLLGSARAVASCEVTPQHLTLAAPDCYEQLGTKAQMNPPIREARHRDALWRGIAEGIVDLIGSDHAPHTAREKDQAYPHSPSGMPGVQTLLPLMLDHLHRGRLDLATLVALTSANAARLFGLKGKGAIKVGYEADFALVDLERRHRIEEKWLASKCGWSPFAGTTVTGWPVMTILRGQVVMRDGALVGAPSGQALRFELAPET